MTTADEKKLDGIIARLLSNKEVLTTDFETIDGIASDHTSAHDDRTDRWRESEAGERSGTIMEALDRIRDAYQNIIDAIDEIESSKDDIDQA